MVSLIVFGLAVALLIVHLYDGRVPRGYVLAAFVASATIAAGDLREAAGQTCVTAMTADNQPIETCVVNYTVKLEALAAFIASVGFTMLMLILYALERLAETVGGWDV